jgi:SAM-dependent methyltransferase
MANVEQRDAWNNVSGDTWVRLQEQFDRTLAGWLDVLAESAQVAGGERVLDVGCGNGATTLDAARRCGPSGLAVGVDLSEQMLARARERAGAAGLGNVRFVAGDAQTDELTVDGQAYDVVVSRFGVMFFDDPVAAFANLAAATRPGGRLVFVAWTGLADQAWITVPGAAAAAHLPLPDMGDDADGPGMFSFADADRVGEVLRTSGWRDVAFDRRTLRERLGGSATVDGALEFLLGSGPGRAMLADAEPGASAKAEAAIRAALAEHLTPRGVELDAAAWLVTAHR